MRYQLSGLDHVPHLKLSYVITATASTVTGFDLTKYTQENLQSTPLWTIKVTLLKLVLLHKQILGFW